ncbi:PREDICTED: uncharacterized protein LOC106313943 [Brassica oleracea var. oleracea]|nr:PREDICTED: uncharacterized protein LOC106313943 [Brassica oleracea var. oleracea]XP_013607331.1 PREDICTED: uncharacterized protein LOC106313943 [Brassica oleracea var. oleracea]XP_013607332.1 PREDICTED: uncharacterized protein LOC106313943 [Brassica oleracea var. oleracea]XP_013607333.1 PREDICTED: uncharacterized protein LOC106313943 [Brassica oleracea var. oleracea]XP_013607334.1 PREDICTED: uncharacterized protein LOC106313943 [Brassica oleracea var. oleracea]
MTVVSCMIFISCLEPGAVDVFLEFICYYGGPLPEDLLPQFKCPVLVAWGEKDPWDPIKLGKAYGNFDAAPQDEKPEMVNPLIESVVARHSKSSTAFAPGI